MTIDPKKKQKRLAKKRAKRKARIDVKKGSKPFRETISLSKAIIIAQRSPVHECLVRKELFEDGIGTVVISRKMRNNHIGAGVFLLDVYCLGVKNAYFTLLTENEYPLNIDKMGQNENFKNIHPSCARKLIEQCVNYAKNLGFNPHKDYRLSQKIFGDIDSTACHLRFDFGKEGKPFYISGPNESFERSKKIINTLLQRCGEDNFDYLTTITQNNEDTFA